MKDNGFEFFSFYNLKQQEKSLDLICTSLVIAPHISLQRAI